MLKKEKITEPPEGKADKIAGKIAGKILRVQGWLSDRMNGFKYLKVLLICFCVLSAGLSIYFFTDAIVSKPKAKVHIDRIHTPRMIDEPSENMYDQRIPDEIYQQIQDYKHYADSAGEPIRPGLADSMRILEELYLQQQK